jgi:hypothetical protein
VESGDWVLADVQAVVAQVLASDGAILSAGEAVLARRVLTLEGPAGRLWARLLGRKPAVFRVSRLAYSHVPDVPAALATLRTLDLVHVAVPEARQLVCYTVAELKGICRREGLSAAGRRAALEERLAGCRGWAREPVVWVACRGLLRRLEALCFQDTWQDRSVWLLDRLGVARSMAYPLTTREPAFARRRDFLAWAAPVSAEIPAEGLASALEQLAPRPRWQRRLCLRRRLERHLEARTRALERDGQAARAAALYQRLLQAGATDPGRVAARLALTLEAAGEPEQGLSAARRWRDQAGPVQGLALDRLGRRLARRGRGRWAPDPPLRTPPERHLRLWLAPAGGARPLWGEPPLPVEQAVARTVPRAVLSAENALWTTLSGLMLFELFWLPVPGMLPRAHLHGPLDLGTPDFAAHRRAALDARLAAIAGGAGLGLLRAAWAHHGVRVRGVHWDAWSLGALEACVAGVGGPALALILRRLAEEGWAAATGLPDLAVLPGPACRLDHAFPARLGPGLVLAEVKGPNDTVRDGQAVWFDRLLRAGAQVELWRVEPADRG